MTDRYMTIYLRDHRALGEACLDLCHRIRRANRDNSIGPAMSELEADLQEDLDLQDRVMDLLKIAPSTWKKLGYRAAQRLGHLKLNGEFFRYSPLSRLLELEGLLAWVDTRRELWMTLEDARRVYPVLEQVPISRMVAQSGRHHQTLRELHQEAARHMIKRGQHPGAR